MLICRAFASCSSKDRTLAGTRTLCQRIAGSSVENMPGTTSCPQAEFVSHAPENIKPCSWSAVVLAYNSLFLSVSHKLTLIFWAKPPLPFGWHLGCPCQPGWGLTPPLETSVDTWVLNCCETSRLVMGNLSFWPFSLPMVGPSRTAVVPITAMRDRPRSRLPRSLPPQVSPRWGLLMAESTSVSTSVPGRHNCQQILCLRHFVFLPFAFGIFDHFCRILALSQNLVWTVCFEGFFSLGKFWFFLWSEDNSQFPRITGFFYCMLSVAQAGLSGGLWLAPKGPRLVLHQCLTTLPSCNRLQNH